jgi:hypothetical protein
MRRRSRQSRSALTLLEVIISLGLIAALLAAMLAFLWQVVDVRDAAAEAADRMQIARQVLSKIEAELRGCVGYEEFGFPIEQPLVEEELLDEAAEFERAPVAEGTVPLLIGDRRNITFLTTALPAEHQYEFLSEADEPPPAQHDLRQVSYWLWVDPEEVDDDGEPIIGGIIRTEKKTLNQFLVELDDPLDVRNDLWSHELGYLEFRYFDGVEWDTTWEVTQGNSLPQLIQVTVGFEPCTIDEFENRDLDDYPLEEYPYGDDQEHPDRYSVIVRIPAADKFFGSRVQKVGQEITETLGVEGLP